MSYHDDAEATQWLQDYWDYVQMIEHGNEPSLDEIGGWDGLAQAFMDEDVFNQTVQYISDDVESDDINSDAGQLLSRLKQLKDRYMGMSKMKKSKNDFNEWIHDVLYQWEMKSGMKLKRLKIDDDQTKFIINRNADQYRQMGDSEKDALEKSVLPNAFTDAGVYDRNNLVSVWDLVDLLYDSMRQRFGIDDRQLAEDIAIATFTDEENDGGYTASSKKMKKMSFTERVCQYIKNNYDIPDRMEFYIGTDGYDFEEWVDAYIEEYNNNVSSPYGDDSDENDVEVVAEEILQIMTAPYKMGNEYVINYDDFEASTKKMKKSIYDDNDWDNDEFYGDNNQRQRLLDYVKRTGTYKGSVPDGRGERQFYDMPDGYTVQFVIDIVSDAVTDVWRTNDFSEWNFPEIQKSQDIHSMIADIRKNNNSLKKSRVDLKFE